ncbi:MAG: acyltransferase family protein [Cyanobacteria bacterium P01_B01_bin.77]
MATRLLFIDNLRVCLTILVVAHHAAQLYGPTGGVWPIVNPERAAILDPFFAVNAAFFMGLFFLISGYCLPAAYDSKGMQQFLLSRFQRLGIPLVFFSLLVFPIVLYRLDTPSVSFFAFIMQTYLHPLNIEVAHLWFLVHLLVYAVCYSLWRQISRQHRWHIAGLANCLGSHPMVAYLLSLTSITFLVRIKYPIDRWVQLFGCVPTEVAHLPQYASLFVIGIMAARCSWLRQITKTQGFLWLGIGLIATLLRYVYSFANLPDIIAGGGWDWRSAVWSGWEATICVGLCMGLLILFREMLNFQNKVLRILSNNAYTVYLIHLLVILYLQLIFAHNSIEPLAKFSLVTLIGVPLCFGVSSLLRKLPLVRQVLS